MKTPKEKKHPKLLYTCHNLPSVILTNNRADIGDATRTLINEKKLRLIALHDEMAQELNEMFGVSNTVVVRNGINMDRFRNETISKGDIRRELKIPEESYVVGHVGRFAVQKNHHFLLQVFNRVLNLNPNAYLLLVGSGSLKSDIMSKADELGITSNMMILSHRDDIHRILRAMDIFVFPSLFEGLGIAVIEAQASGLKCIISDCVPDDAIITNQVIKLNLDAGLDVWANAVFNPSLPELVDGDYISYDMKHVVKQLEELYK